MAVLSLALVVGANTAVFSVADAVLFRPLPYKDPDQLCLVRMVDRRTGAQSSRVPITYLEALLRAATVERIAGRGTVSTVLQKDEDGTAVSGWLTVSPDFLDVLGVQPQHGRLFTETDADGQGQALILTFGLWQRRFAADPSIVGRTVLLGEAPREVVGVLPRDFVLPAESIPLSFLQGQTLGYEYIGVRPANALLPGGFVMEPVLRLKRGVTLAQAQAELEVVATSLARVSPNPEAVPTLFDLRAALFPAGRRVMRLLLVASSAVLLLGCVNLAHLLLTGARSRMREVGVRAALGASRVRLIWSTFADMVPIGAAAAVAALLGGHLTFTVLARQVPASLHGGLTLGIDLRVILFTLTLAGLSSVAAVALPAWDLWSNDVQAHLTGRGADRSHRHRVMGGVAISVQVALATTLGVGGVVAAASLRDVLRVPLGFSSDRVVTITTMPAGLGRSLRAFYGEAVELLAARGDVVAASATDALPLATTAVGGGDDDLQAQGVSAIPTSSVLPDYFATIGVPILHGREFARADTRPGYDLVVINRSASRQIFGSEDSVGRTVHTKGGRSLRVIGVVADVRMTLARPAGPLAYIISPPEHPRSMTLVVRVRHQAPALTLDLRRAVGTLVKNMPVTAMWWTDVIDATAEYRTPRFQTLVLGAFSALGLALTAIGVFSVVSFYVARQQHELATRMVLGASPRSIGRLVGGRVAVPVVIGLLGALPLGLGANRLVGAHVEGLREADPTAYVLSGVLALSAALLSAYVPVRKATRLDLARLLRGE